MSALARSRWLVAILLPLIEGRQHGWPLWTWLSLASADVLLTMFVVYQRRLRARGGAPLLELGLFRERTFSAGLLAQLFLACAQASFFVYLALYLQRSAALAPASEVWPRNMRRISAALITTGIVIGSRAAGIRGAPEMRP